MNHRGFTLIELLVVIVIVLAISAIALPVIIPAWRHRQVSEGARLTQAALTGARDAAKKSGSPQGIRLLIDPTLNGIGDPTLPDGSPNPFAGIMDPTKPLAANRIMPIAPPPNYSEGNLLIVPDAVYPDVMRTVNGYAGAPCLVIEQAVIDSQKLPLPPTSWYWNIRVGDKIQINNSGPWYTIVGPMVVPPEGLYDKTVNPPKLICANVEMFVNIGVPGTPPPLLSQNLPAEFLLVVNGVDDNGNGWVDEGYDGVDNNGNGRIDELAEWETERWLGSIKP